MYIEVATNMELTHGCSERILSILGILSIITISSYCRRKTVKMKEGYAKAYEREIMMDLILGVSTIRELVHYVDTESMAVAIMRVMFHYKERISQVCEFVRQDKVIRVSDRNMWSGLTL